MSEEPKDPTKVGQGEGEPSDKDAIIESLKSQIENLNKGIATYRDEAKTALEAAKAANEQVAGLMKEFKENNDKDKDEPLSPEDQKKFEAWAKSKGVVTQEELATYKQNIASQSAKDVADTAVSQFLEAHPEYDDDIAWAKVQEEFVLYKTPVDLAGYKKLLEKIHKQLSGGDEDKTRAKVKAELKNKEHLSLGGRGKAGAGNEDTEARIDKLQERYPNLSRAQIEARLSEIDSIYKK